MSTLFGDDNSIKYRMPSQSVYGIPLVTYQSNDTVYVKNTDMRLIVFHDINVVIGFSPRGHYFRAFYTNQGLGRKDIIKVFKSDGRFYYQYYGGQKEAEMVTSALTYSGVIITTIADEPNFNIYNPIYGINKRVKLNPGALGIEKSFSPDGTVIYVSPFYSGGNARYSKGMVGLFAFDNFGEHMWEYSFRNFSKNTVFSSCSFKQSISGDFILLNASTTPEQEWYGHEKIVMINNNGEYLWHIDSLNAENIQFDENLLRLTGSWRSSINHRDQIMDINLFTGEIINKMKKPRNKY